MEKTILLILSSSFSISFFFPQYVNNISLCLIFFFFVSVVKARAQQDSQQSPPLLASDHHYYYYYRHHHLSPRTFWRAERRPDRAAVATSRGSLDPDEMGPSLRLAHKESSSSAQRASLASHLTRDALGSCPSPFLQESPQRQRHRSLVMERKTSSAARKDRYQHGQSCYCYCCWCWRWWCCHSGGDGGGGHERHEIVIRQLRQHARQGEVSREWTRSSGYHDGLEEHQRMAGEETRALRRLGNQSSLEDPKKEQAVHPNNVKIITNFSLFILLFGCLPCGQESLGEFPCIDGQRRDLGICW
jgi:hypothetical protein